MTIFGVGDKVILNLEKGSNKLFAEYQGKIVYIQSIDTNGWYYVSLHPRGEGVKIPVREYEMEMRYQHCSNWSVEQWEMYHNSTTNYIGNTEKKEEMSERPEIGATADFECKAYGTHFLAAIGTVGEEIGSAVDFFNTNVDVYSEIVAVQLIVRSKGKNTSPPLKVELVGSNAFVDGSYRYGLVFSDVDE